MVRPGDIFISRAGSVGESHLTNHVPTPSVFASYLIRFKPLEGVEQRFVAYYLQTPQYWMAISENTAGIAVPNVNASKLEMIELPIAPLSEQRRIVEKIEELLTDLDAGVAALERVRDKLKRYRAAVLKAAVEGQLTAQWRKEHPDTEPAEKLLARILADRRQRWVADQLDKWRAKRQAAGWTSADIAKALPAERKKIEANYRPPATPDIANLPDLPPTWCWATVEHLAVDEANSITDGPFGSNLKTSHYTQLGPRVVRLQNIGDGEFIDEEAHISQSHFEGLAKHHVFGGDVVIALLGDALPRACVVPDSLGPALVKADCIRYKPDRQLAKPRYVVSALNAFTTRRFVAEVVHGVGRPRLNLGELMGVPLPLPPLAEQAEIVSIVEDKLSISEAAEKVVERQLARAGRLRQSILKQAFEGKLVPQDPCDEPAEVLLARIRSQRQAAASTARAKTKPQPPRRRGRRG